MNDKLPEYLLRGLAAIVGTIAVIGCTGLVVRHSYLMAASEFGGFLNGTTAGLIAIVALVGPAYAAHLFQTGQRHLSAVVWAGAALAMPMQIANFMHADNRPPDLKMVPKLFGIPPETAQVWDHAYLSSMATLSTAVFLMVALVTLRPRSKEKP